MRVAFEKELDGIERRISYRFARRELLRQALTHSSWSNEERAAGDRQMDCYERLEFLGDRVLGLVVSEELYRMKPQEKEGNLSKRYAWLVDEEALAEAGRELGLGEVMRLGGQFAGSKTTVSMVADAVEALIGALYLDRDVDAARKFIMEFIWSREALGDEPLQAVPRNILQERCDRLREGSQVQGPFFTCTSSGPEHERSFTCMASVIVDGKTYTALAEEAPSQKAAKKAAAASLLEKLAVERTPV